jgi:hypothetical protein
MPGSSVLGWMARHMALDAPDESGADLQEDRKLRAV